MRREAGELGGMQAAAAAEVEDALAGRVAAHPVVVEVVARLNYGVELLVRREVGVTLRIGFVEATELVVELGFFDLSRFRCARHWESILTAAYRGVATPTA